MEIWYSICIVVILVYSVVSFSRLHQRMSDTDTVLLNYINCAPILQQTSALYKFCTYLLTCSKRFQKITLTQGVIRFR